MQPKALKFEEAKERRLRAISSTAHIIRESRLEALICILVMVGIITTAFMADVLPKHIFSFMLGCTALFFTSGLLTAAQRFVVAEDAKKQLIKEMEYCDQAAGLVSK